MTLKDLISQLETLSSHIDSDTPVVLEQLGTTADECVSIHVFKDYDSKNQVVFLGI